jgi:hypothetical protein
MSDAKSKNVKIPVELEELVKSRAPDVPPGETLFAIYKEYEKLEALAKCVTNKDIDMSKTSVYEVLKTYIDLWGTKFDGYHASIDELKTMLKSLERFFTIIKSPP